MTTSDISLDQRLLRLFEHLGFSRAHIGYQAPRDLADLLSNSPEAVASIAVTAANSVDTAHLAPSGKPLLFIRGDSGHNAPAVPRSLPLLPNASVTTLAGYQDVIWGDIMAERTNEASDALLNHLATAQAADPLPSIAPDSQEGWVDDVWFQVQGSGPPLALFPIAFAPSQWEPLIPRLRERYCVITLGGALLGAAAALEERARMPWYRAMLRNLLSAADPQPGESMVEVGCGCGAVLRFVAEYTGRANHILGVDINPYLLREARAQVDRAELEPVISLREGSAEQLPLNDNSFDVTLCITVLEEGDADRMLSELVRVTKPGGRVAIMIRSVDVPWWISFPLSESTQEKVVWVDKRVASAGCADASLAPRMISAGLERVTMTPQLAAQAPGTYRDGFLASMRSLLSLDEQEEWDQGLETARADGTLSLASSYYLAVGVKP